MAAKIPIVMSKGVLSIFISILLLASFAFAQEAFISRSAGSDDKIIASKLIHTPGGSIYEQYSDGLVQLRVLSFKDWLGGLTLYGSREAFFCGSKSYCDQKAAQGCKIVSKCRDGIDYAFCQGESQSQINSFCIGGTSTAPTPSTCGFKYCSIGDCNKDYTSTRCVDGFSYELGISNNVCSYTKTSQKCGTTITQPLIPSQPKTGTKEPYIVVEKLEYRWDPVNSLVPVDLTIKNTGADMPDYWIIEIEPKYQGRSAKVLAQSACDPENPQIVHIAYKLNSGESTNLNFKVPIINGDGTYILTFGSVTGCCSSDNGCKDTTPFNGLNKQPVTIVIEGSKKEAKKCEDDSLYGQCSKIKLGYLCSSETGQLVKREGFCGCSSGTQAQPDGTCKKIDVETELAFSKKHKCDASFDGQCDVVNNKICYSRPVLSINLKDSNGWMTYEDYDKYRTVSRIIFGASKACDFCDHDQDCKELNVKKQTNPAGTACKTLSNCNGKFDDKGVCQDIQGDGCPQGDKLGILYSEEGGSCTAPKRCAAGLVCVTKGLISTCRQESSIPETSVYKACDGNYYGTKAKADSITCEVVHQPTVWLCADGITFYTEKAFKESCSNGSQQKDSFKYQCGDVLYDTQEERDNKCKIKTPDVAPPPGKETILVPTSDNQDGKSDDGEPGEPDICYTCDPADPYIGGADEISQCTKLAGQRCTIANDKFGADNTQASDQCASGICYDGATGNVCGEKGGQYKTSGNALVQPHPTCLSLGTTTASSLEAADTKVQIAIDPKEIAKMTEKDLAASACTSTSQCRSGACRNINYLIEQDYITSEEAETISSKVVNFAKGTTVGTTICSIGVGVATATGAGITGPGAIIAGAGAAKAIIPACAVVSAGGTILFDKIFGSFKDKGTDRGFCIDTSKENGEFGKDFIKGIQDSLSVKESTAKLIFFGGLIILGAFIIKLLTGGR